MTAIHMAVFYHPLQFLVLWYAFGVGFSSSFSVQVGLVLTPQEVAREKRSPYNYVVGTMAKRLYVGGLPYSTTDDELKEAFSKAGAVSSASVIMDKMTGRSRGFGFIEMDNDDEAEKAIEMWNGKELGGRNLTVNEAKPMGERAPRRNFGGGNRFGNSY